MKHPSHYFVGIFCGIASALIWGGFPVMTRLGVSRADFDAWDMAFIRFFFSGLLVIPYMLLHKQPKIPLKGALIMVLGIGAPYMFVVAQGLLRAPVEQFAVVVPASMIAFSLLMSIFIFKTPIRKNEYLGIGIIILGIGTVGALTLQNANKEAYFIFLFAGFMWASYTSASRRYCQSALHATIFVCFYSMLFYSPFYLYFKGWSIFANSPPSLWIQIIYQGFFVSLVALFFFSKAVFVLGSTVGSVFAALVPALATIMSSILLDEYPNIYSVMGLVIITTGMLVTIWKPK